MRWGLIGQVHFVDRRLERRRWMTSRSARPMPGHGDDSERDEDEAREDGQERHHLPAVRAAAAEDCSDLRRQPNFKHVSAHAQLPRAPALGGSSRRTTGWPLLGLEPEMAANGCQH